MSKLDGAIFYLLKGGEDLKEEFKNLKTPFIHHCIIL
jgi:hypothetical protein